ncbi:MAG: glycosyltransferase family 2 protein [Patescibacteria group bacterium]
MGYLLTIFSSSVVFLLVYFQVFLLLTLFEHEEGGQEPSKGDLSHTLYRRPTVTILVPVFNEETTVEKTIYSILDLNYPSEKLKIMIVDDGSVDNTWNLIQKFVNHPQILLHQKENGGKYTALNYGIKHTTSEFIGCLDADSFVDREALNYILPYFDDEQTMAVTPSMKIQNPDSMLGLMQNAEYNLGVFTRKIFSILDAQYVTPGPFSIFRKEAFNKVGVYKHAHNTEDLEMALRLQEKHYKITNAHKALVYTAGPRTLYKLYKQRVRWTGGFIQNIIDYRQMILNPKYGNFGMLILPTALYSIIGSLFFLCYSAFNIARQAYEQYIHLKAVGWNIDWSVINIPQLTSEWWYYNLQPALFLGLLTIILIIFGVWYGKRMAGVPDHRFSDIFFFLVLYSLVSPLWLVTSVYNTIRHRDAAWR